MTAEVKTTATTVQLLEKNECVSQTVGKVTLQVDQKNPKKFEIVVITPDGNKKVIVEREFSEETSPRKRYESMADLFEKTVSEWEKEEARTANQPIQTLVDKIQVFVKNLTLPL